MMMMMMMIMKSSDSGGQTVVFRASFTFFFFFATDCQTWFNKPFGPHTDYGTVRNYLCSVVVGVPGWAEYRTVFLFLAGDFVRRKSHRMSFDRLVSLAEQSIWLITSALAYGSGGIVVGWGSTSCGPMLAQRPTVPAGMQTPECKPYILVS